jgi:hypothetical protein
MVIGRTPESKLAADLDLLHTACITCGKPCVRLGVLIRRTHDQIAILVLLRELASSYAHALVECVANVY